MFVDADLGERRLQRAGRPRPPSCCARSTPFRSTASAASWIATAAGLDNLVNGPEVKQALISLECHARSSVQDTVQNLDAGLAPAMKRLPDMAASLQKTMTDANRLVLSLQAGYGDNTQFNRDLDRLLIQLNDATRSIRALADLLARHPEALIKGRPAGGVE